MAYQIKITIMDIEPAIWRRLRIPGNITFRQLHQIIQAAFGWLDYHLHKFEFDKYVVTIPNDDYAPGELYGEDLTELDTDKTVINDLFDAYDRCIYEYDFGDSWEHEIIVEKRLKDTKKNSIPECLDGARQRPPEDVGGINGFAGFLKTIKGKNKREREEMLSWAEKDTRGRIYDPDYFSKNEINRSLLFALEDDREHAELLLGEKGLTGTVEWGWMGTGIKADRRVYPMEQIERMLLRLGDDYKVTIKAEPLRKKQ